MTHDPLCRATSGTFCDCPLIARVRETWYESQSETWEQGYAAGLRDAKAAVMAVPRGGWGLKVHEHYRNCIAAIEALGGER